MAKKNATGDKFKAAVTFPGGTHDLWMRYWLAANGVNPNKDANLVVIPRPKWLQTCNREPWIPSVWVSHGTSAL